MKTLRDKINEGFFDNIGGKELIFLKELKDTLDDWKASGDRDSLINQLDRLCYKAKKENFNFDIRVEKNSSSKNKYVTFIKFWNKYYKVSDKPDGRPTNNNCWTVYHALNTKYIFTDFNPSDVNCNTYIMGEYIDKFVKNYDEGSKRNLIFKVRIFLEDLKNKKWM